MTDDDITSLSDNSSNDNKLIPEKLNVENPVAFKDLFFVFISKERQKHYRVMNGI